MSTTVYIGHAVGDEHGRARGGEAGNQSGKELRISPWYLNSKGWRVLRAIDPVVRMRLADDMRRACNNPNIGYDQSQRNTLWAAVSPYGFDCARVEKPVECDCSSLVRVCLAYAGIRVDNFNTESEAKRLLATGKFEEMKGDQYQKQSAYLLEGDVLVTCTKGHTCIVLNNGDKAEPQPVPPPTPTEKEVLVVGDRVHVRAGDSTDYPVLFTAKKGDRYPYAQTAPSGWYEIVARGSTAFISNKPHLTRLVIGICAESGKQACLNMYKR